jgi:hypothetical protein
VYVLVKIDVPFVSVAVAVAKGWGGGVLNGESVELFSVARALATKLSNDMGPSGGGLTAKTIPVLERVMSPKCSNPEISPLYHFRSGFQLVACSGTRRADHLK